jgi:F-box-like
MAASTAATWDKLPDALMLLILNFVPVDTRLLCLLVCRYWCTLLGRPEAWTRLDLSVLPRKTRSAASNEAIFRGFVAKGAGKIITLDFTGIYGMTFQTLLEVVRANAATLETLRTPVRRSRDARLLFCGHHSLVRSPACRPASYIKSRMKAATKLQQIKSGHFLAPHLR